MGRVCRMGKRLYERYNISPEKTQRLDIEELCVLATEEDDLQYQQLLNDTFLRKKQLAQHAEGKGLEPQKSSPVNSKISFRLMMGTHA